MIMKLKTSVLLLFLAALSLYAKDKEKSDVTINSDELKYSFEENTAYLRGHVVVTDGERKLTTDNATVYFEEDKKGGDQAVEDLGLKGVDGFSRVVAVGNVHVVFNDQTNTKTEVIADRGIWEKAQNKVIMTGGPPIVRNGSNYIRCRRLTVDLLKAKCDFESPEIILTPSNEDKEKFLF